MIPTLAGMINPPPNPRPTSDPALAPHLPLGTDLSVGAEPVDGLIDQVHDILVADVGVPGVVVGVDGHPEGAGAPLHQLVLLVGGHGPGAAAGDVADDVLAVADRGGGVADLLDEGRVAAVVDAVVGG